MSRTVELWLVWALAAALAGWQLFVPPIIGLADQGDFVRVLGPMGYAPQPKGPEHKYWYVTRTFVWDPTYREPRWEQITSEFIPVALALGLNRVFANPARFDITIVGLVHLLLFLAAFARLLYVTRNLARHLLVWALMLLVLTDVGYVAYWNSLYTEPASCLWFLFLLAESIALSTSEWVTMGPVLRWNGFAVLWVLAKTQNAVLCVPLVAYGLLLAWRAFDGKTRWAACVGAIAVLAAGTVMYRTLLPAPRMVNMYNMIFFAILPESDDRAADLQALGLDPGYAMYSGTLAWTAGSGIADGRVVNAIQANVTPLGLVEFYLRRPARFWKHVRGALRTALFLRPEFCGNYDAAAGKLPGARNHAIAAWSWFHERWLSRMGSWLLGGLMLGVMGGMWGLWKGRPGTARLHRVPLGAQDAILPHRWMELGVFLAVCCLLAFFAAAFGDAWDVVKHQYLFNLLLDACLVFGISALVSNARFTDRRSDSR